MFSNLLSMGTTASGTLTCLSDLISISAATYVFWPFLSPFSSYKANKVFSPRRSLRRLADASHKAWLLLIHDQ